MADIEALGRIVVDCAYAVHRDFGPGLMESAYQKILASTLRLRGLLVECEKAIDIEYEGEILRAAFKIDMLVEKKLVLELKSTEFITPLHIKQTLTYLRLMDLELGYVLNFGAAAFSGVVKRTANDYYGQN